MDLKDTQDGLGEDQKFLAELAKGCKTKEAEWEVVVKTRSEEMLALSETIKILNDDDALDRSSAKIKVVLRKCCSTGSHMHTGELARHLQAE